MWKCRCWKLYEYRWLWFQKESVSLMYRNFDPSNMLLIVVIDLVISSSIHHHRRVIIIVVCFCYHTKETGKATMHCFLFQKYEKPVVEGLVQPCHVNQILDNYFLLLNINWWLKIILIRLLFSFFITFIWKLTRSYTADAVLYRQPSGQPTNTVMLNLNWLRVEKVSWQWSVGRVTVPRLSTWYDVT